jgi:hypothetical protein
VNAESWGWPALFLLGAYQGLNPGMGWLFAVALGMQERRRAAIARALLPMTAGHVLAIAAAIGVARLLGLVVSSEQLKVIAAAALFAFGAYRVLRHRRRQAAAIRVGFLELTLWSFLMSSAHGAGLLAVPVLFGISLGAHSGDAISGGTTTYAALAVGVHAAGYLAMAALVAFVVHEMVCLVVPRQAWVNVDLIWAAALVLTAVFTLAI